VSALPDAAGEVAAAVERELAALLPPVEGPLAQLAEAMRYAALGAGKRFRPLLVAAAARLGPADPAAVTRVGAAIELIHAYSLVHDDLPAMDDATLRRGKPACHRVYGEALAILVGDALQALAFEALAGGDWPAPAELRAELVGGLAGAAGPLGMCGGQHLDLADAGRAGDAARIAYVEGLKTGALIAFATTAGGRLAGLDGERLAALGGYAQALGLAFQITDDLLDHEGDPRATGKDAGLDATSGKATLVGVLGVAGARARLAALEREASSRLDIFGCQGTLLRRILSYVVTRTA
jgi:farnesyl diphosphate synthase